MTRYASALQVLQLNSGVFDTGCWTVAAGLLWDLIMVARSGYSENEHHYNNTDVFSLYNKRSASMRFVV